MTPYGNPQDLSPMESAIIKQVLTIIKYVLAIKHMCIYIYSPYFPMFSYVFPIFSIIFPNISSWLPHESPIVLLRSWSHTYGAKVQASNTLMGLRRNSARSETEQGVLYHENSRGL